MQEEKQKIPLNHVAIIMDGNGRWANGRSHRRIWGHIRGSNVVSDIVEQADDLGINYLTLFAFSSENWSRPVGEIKVLFKLLKKFIKKERIRILQNNIRFRIIGDISGLPEDTRILIEDLENETKENGGLNLTFAFGYGGREEIIEAVNRHIISNPGTPIDQIMLSSRLLLPAAGDVDLLIRTGGNTRISNFLLWQISYAELFFTETKWPDFSKEEFNKIVSQFLGRERRFGATTAKTDLSETKIMAQKNRELFLMSKN